MKRGIINEWQNIMKKKVSERLPGVTGALSGVSRSA
jgi:hypothetical protein